MKGFRYLLLIFGLMTIVSVGCNRKSGCPANDNLKVKTNRKGEFKRSKSKSQLFDKKRSKRMKN